ncbi:MAG: GxxExxY protein [Bacteroidales bacterium]|nr:GxxExxY protein [Bacteroidales bacterium]
MTITKQYIKQLNYKIVGAAIKVHKQLGPGLLESIYEECLYEELLSQGLYPKRQVKVPVIYKGKQVKDDLRIDLLINNTIIVELKSVNELHPIFEAQLMTYMKLAEKSKGLLINFNVTKLTDGIVPIVNELFANLPDK